MYGVLFVFWRILQIITLIPTVGMLAYFVDIYNKNNALTPDSILVLFIVSVLAVVWAIGTLFTYHRSKQNSRFVGVVDILFVGAFIGAVWTLRGISKADCTKNTAGYETVGLGAVGSITYQGVDIQTDKTCGMLKASWAFGIMNCIFFFITGLIALVLGGRRRDKVVVRRGSHSSRHGHRTGSHRSGYRSSYSGSRRTYV